MMLGEYNCFVKYSKLSELKFVSDDDQHFFCSQQTKMIIKAVYPESLETTLANRDEWSVTAKGRILDQVEPYKTGWVINISII